MVIVGVIFLKGRDVNFAVEIRVHEKIMDEKAWIAKPDFVFGLHPWRDVPVR
jgi:hypothetical protein